MAMAFGRTLVSKIDLSTFFYRSFTTSLTTTNRSFTSTLLRFRPLVVLAEFRGTPSLTVGTRSFATRPTTSSLNDPSPNFSNRPPKETILLDGCDFEHWLVVLEKPPEEWTRDEIIDHYIKTLAQVVGSEEEARMKIYSVSTRCYFAFGALVSEEMSEKLKALEKVRWVLPDSYLDVRNKDYGGEPFINGQAVPYDPKYHEEWIKNNSRANDRSRRNDRPRNNDRSRNFERRRENQQSRDFQSPMPNRPVEGPPGAPAMVGAPGAPPNGGMPPRGNFQNTVNMGNMPPNPNAPNSQQYMGGGQPHPNMQFNAPNAPNPTMQYNAPNAPNPTMQYNAHNAPNPNNQYNAPNPNPNNQYNAPNPNNQYNAPNPNPNNQYNAPNPNNQYNAPNPNMQYNPPNMGGMPPRNAGYPNNAPRVGSMPNQDAPNGGGAPYQSREAPGAMPNRGFQNNDYALGGNMGGPPSGNQYQVRDVPVKDQDYQH